jgi:tetratricopeptide (TPR) repeat protein
VVALAPNNALGFNVLAPYYDRLGCPENSLRAYQKALEIDRGNAGIYTNLATTLFYLGRYREAIEYAKLGLVYLEEDEKSGQPTYIDRGNLAEILYWSSGGDKNQALANFEKALEEVDVYLKDNPGDPYDLSRKAIFQAIIGEKEAAEITIEQALTSETPAAAVLYRAAIIYQHIGRTDRAVRYLEQSLQAGQATSVARNEPIFREAAAFRELLSNYPESGGPCP